MIHRQVIALFVAICWASEIFLLGVIAHRDPQSSQRQMPLPAQQFGKTAKRTAIPVPPTQSTQSASVPKPRQEDLRKFIEGDALRLQFMEAEYQKHQALVQFLNNHIEREFQKAGSDERKQHEAQQLRLRLNEIDRFHNGEELENLLKTPEFHLKYTSLRRLMEQQKGISGAADKVVSKLDGKSARREEEQRFEVIYQQNQERVRREREEIEFRDRMKRQQEAAARANGNVAAESGRAHHRKAPQSTEPVVRDTVPGTPAKTAYDLQDEQWAREDMKRKEDMARKAQRKVQDKAGMRVPATPVQRAYDLQDEQWEQEKRKREIEMTRSVKSLQKDNAGNVPSRSATGACEQDKKWAEEDMDRKRYVQMKRGK